MEAASRPTESSTTHRLLDAVAAGETDALDELLARHRTYVRRVIDVRLEAPLQARVDPSDIVQETLVVASRRLDDFLERRPTSFRIWLRQHALERLIDARRQHLRLKRDARRDMQVTDASSMALATGLLGNRPSEHVMRRELIEQIRDAMLALNEQDREILLLRHGEQLTSGECAEALSISVSAASKRYGRAVGRLSVELRRLGFRND